MECELYLNIVIILKINNNTLNKKASCKRICTTESYVHASYMHTYKYYA